jgi:hypothetical protein
LPRAVHASARMRRRVHDWTIPISTLSVSDVAE